MIIAGVGASPAVGPTSGGKVYAFNNIGTSPIVVAPANPQRTTITFHNPGSTDIVVFPSVVQALNSIGTISNQTLTPTTAALGGGYRVYGNGGSFTLSGECQGSYQALAVSGSSNPFTVTDSNA